MTSTVFNRNDENLFVIPLKKQFPCLGASGLVIYQASDLGGQVFASIYVANTCSFGRSISKLDPDSHPVWDGALIAKDVDIVRDRRRPFEYLAKLQGTLPDLGHHKIVGNRIGDLENKRHVENAHKSRIIIIPKIDMRVYDCVLLPHSDVCNSESFHRLDLTRKISFICFYTGP
jgi:hypothetical protein